MLDALERKMLYAFLSALFRHPDEQTLESARAVEETTFESVFPGLSRPPVPGIDDLRASYARLFGDGSNAGQAPPYGSAYLEPAGRNNSTRIVASLYATAGLDTEQSPEPPDYLPTEMEYLFYLTEGEQQSREGNTDISPGRWIASQADFFHNFLAPWIPSFCERIEKSDAHPFYLWAADLLRRFVDLEKERLKAA